MNCYNPYQYKTEEERRKHVGLNTVPCCSVNPRYLHEDRVPNELPEASVKKKTVVVGGGPAGMQAAFDGGTKRTSGDSFRTRRGIGRTVDLLRV